MEKKIIITFIESPVTFYAQNVKDAEKFGELSKDISNFCYHARGLNSSPNKEIIYAAKYPEDRNWYRCKLSAAISETKNEVFYIDFGDSAIMHNRDMILLPSHLQNVAPFCHRYMLDGVQKNSYMTEDQEKTARLWLKNLVSEKIIHAVTRNITSILMTVAECWFQDKGIWRNVSQEVYNKRYAKKCGVGPKSECPRSILHSASPSPWNPTHQSYIERVSVSSPIRDGRRDYVALNNQDSLCELEDTKRVIVVLEEKNHLLNLKNNRLSKEAQTMKLLPKLAEIHELLNKREKLSSQYLGNETEDPILAGEKIIRSPNYVDEDLYKVSLSYLQVNFELFQEAQKKIYNKSYDDLDSAVTNRNRIKNDLQFAINDFLKDSANGMFDEKFEEIEKVMKGVEAIPGLKLNQSNKSEMDIETIATEYKEWKVEKVKKIKQVHIQVDNLKEQVKSMFWDITNLFEGNDVSLPKVDVEDLLKKLKTALTEEIQNCNNRRYDNKTVPFLKICAAIHTALLERCKCLKEIVELRNYVADLNEKLEGSLKEIFDVSEIVKVKKEIKACVSRTRHLIIDKYDAEEEEPVDEEKIKNIKSDISVVSETIKELQESEKKLVAGLQKSCHQHYPELRATYPDIDWSKSTLDSLVGLDRSPLYTATPKIASWAQEVDKEEKNETEKSVHDEFDALREELEQLEVTTTESGYASTSKHSDENNPPSDTSKGSEDFSVKENGHVHTEE